MAVILQSAEHSASDQADLPSKALSILLVSAYELGHQPFSVASATAWLEQAGHAVETQDLAIERLDDDRVAAADLIGFSVPMHTATRMVAKLMPRVRKLNPNAHVAVFGLYGPVNQDLCRSLQIDSILGGEFETGLVSLANRIATGIKTEDELGRQLEPVIALERQRFIVPDRSSLPALDRYAFLTMPDGSRRVTGYTEATRGCKHLCRHCPIVPVYGGAFRVVDRQTVIADIAQQVDAGAQHITFGDPDFFNGPGHALKIVRELHERWPDLSYDVTIKAEHILQQRDHLAELAETGCVLLTCAFESVDERILDIFDKRHTRSEMNQVVQLLRDAGVALNPTFVAFSPWISLTGYQDLLRWIAEQGLVEQVSSIQYGIRLLIPEGSRLLELPETWSHIGAFDREALSYPWQHPDPMVDELQQTVMHLIMAGQETGLSRAEIFASIWSVTAAALGSIGPNAEIPEPKDVLRAPVPYLSEPWYC